MERCISGLGAPITKNWADLLGQPPRRSRILSLAPSPAPVSFDSGSPGKSWDYEDLSLNKSRPSIGVSCAHSFQWTVFVSS